MGPSRAGVFASIVATGVLGLVVVACSDKGAGCSKDSDCKGDRVCKSGVCKEDNDDKDDEKSKKPSSKSSAPASRSGTSSPVPLQPAPPTAPAVTIPMASCKNADVRLGTFTPSVADVVAAARLIPTTSCLKTDELADLLRRCGSERGSGLVAIEATVPDRSACNVSIHTLDANGRRWINVGLFVGRQEKFHSETYIFELQNGRPNSYFRGTMGGSPLCDGSNDPDSQGNDTSSAMRADWARIDPATRTNFFCSDGSQMPSLEQPQPKPACSEGTTASCDCPPTGKGTRTCVNGEFSGCDCRVARPPRGRCVNGQTRACPCGDGTNGQATCFDGSWSSCAMCD